MRHSSTKFIATWQRILAKILPSYPNCFRTKLRQCLDAANAEALVSLSPVQIKLIRKHPSEDILKISPPCRRASHSGAATVDAALPPHCQAGRRCRVIATTNATALLPLLLQLRHRRRRAIPATTRGAASTVAKPPPPLPRCQAGRNLHAAAAIATVITPQPPPPPRYPMPPR